MSYTSDQIIIRSLERLFPARRDQAARSALTRILISAFAAVILTGIAGCTGKETSGSTSGSTGGSTGSSTGSSTGGVSSRPSVQPDLSKAVFYKNQGIVDLENTGASVVSADAVSEFHKVSEYAPTDPLGYINEALASSRGSAPPAPGEEANITKALSLAPRSAAVHLLAGQIRYAWFGNEPARLPEAEQEIDKSLAIDPDNIQAQWEWLRERTNGGMDMNSDLPDGALPHLKKLEQLAPGNLVVITRLAQAYIQANQAAQAIPYIQKWKEEVWLPSKDFSPTDIGSMLDGVLARLRAGDSAGGRGQMLTAGNLTKHGPVSLSAMTELYPGVEGVPLTRLKDEPDSNTPIGPPVAVAFKDMTAASGLSGAGGSSGAASVTVGSLVLVPHAAKVRVVFATGKFPPPDLLVVGRDGKTRAWRDQGHHYLPDPAALPSRGQVSSVLAGDFESPAGDIEIRPEEKHPLDLVLLGTGGATYLYRTPDNQFKDRTKDAALTGLHAPIGCLMDFNHDGNLDIIAGGATTGLQVYAGRSDFRFENGSSQGADADPTGRRFSGLQDGTGHALAAPFKGIASGFAVADYDQDGATDVYVANRVGPGVLYHNRRQGLLEDGTLAAGLSGAPPAACAATADWNNDGAPDLAVGGLEGSGLHLYRNRGNGAFVESTPTAISGATKGLKVSAVTFLDYDNDGLQDIAVGVAPLPGHPAPASGLLLFHNLGHDTFEDATRILPTGLPPMAQIATADRGDGGMSLFGVTGAGKLLLLQNVGGNKNHWLNVNVWGHQYPNGRVAPEGIGSAIQLTAAARFQQQTVAGQVTHFGLGNIAHPDIIRTLLTDGIPQDYPDTSPASSMKDLKELSDMTLTELVLLKGSCPFVYGWDGNSFRFMTDALCAAPLGLLLSSSVYAPANHIDYVMAPHWLRPRNGRLTIAVAEELAELTYLDSVQLMAVDHPTGTTVVSNESFGGMRSTLPWYVIQDERSPIGAWDTSGHDVLKTILNEDKDYVHDFGKGLYPGITNDHWLTLDLGRFSQTTPTTLFLNGWIRWTNTSINVAMSHDQRVHPEVPRIEVPDSKGQWHTVIPFIGLIAGKTKTMAVDLSGKFLCADHRVRIRTNYEIYWDRAFFTLGSATNKGARVQAEDPCKANLNYHGFSEMKQVAAFGPTAPVYADHVSRRVWPPIPGYCTRYGDVTDMLCRTDDRWVAINSGDQCTIQFKPIAPPPPGMVRDYLIKLDGWDKDNDYHTAFSGSVEPYPFHGMKSYPYPGSQHYPDDPAHQEFLRTTLTRYVSRQPFLADLQRRSGSGG